MIKILLISLISTSFSCFAGKKINFDTSIFNRQKLDFARFWVDKGFDNVLLFGRADFGNREEVHLINNQGKTFPDYGLKSNISFFFKKNHIVYRNWYKSKINIVNLTNYSKSTIDIPGYHHQYSRGFTLRAFGEFVYVHYEAIDFDQPNYRPYKQLIVNIKTDEVIYDRVSDNHPSEGESINNIFIEDNKLYVAYFSTLNSNYLKAINLKSHQEVFKEDLFSGASAAVVKIKGKKYLFNASSHDHALISLETGKTIKQTSRNVRHPEDACLGPCVNTENIKHLQVQGKDYAVVIGSGLVTRLVDLETLESTFGDTLFWGKQIFKVNKEVIVVGKTYKEGKAFHGALKLSNQKAFNLMSYDNFNQDTLKIFANDTGVYRFYRDENYVLLGRSHIVEKIY